MPVQCHRGQTYVTSAEWTMATGKAQSFNVMYLHEGEGERVGGGGGGGGRGVSEVSVFEFSSTS